MQYLNKKKVINHVHVILRNMPEISSPSSLDNLLTGIDSCVKLKLSEDGCLMLDIQSLKNILIHIISSLGIHSNLFDVHTNVCFLFFSL